MDFYSPLYFGYVVVTLTTLAATPLFGLADAPPIPERNRYLALDGLRGFCALAVFGHHAAIYHQFNSTGVWDLPPSSFYTMLGQTGVSLFFMITGFLFWSKMLTAGGSPNFRRLYIGRLFRICPLYSVAAAVMLIWTANCSQPEKSQSPLAIASETAMDLAFGLFPIDPINNVPQTGMTFIGVTWTLRFEWLFYLSLLPLAVMARSRLRSLIFTGYVLVIAIGIQAAHPERSIGCVAFFAAGMLSASLSAGSRENRKGGMWKSILILACFSVNCVAFRSAFAPLPIIFTATAFYFIVSGGDIFGLLTSRAALRLGNISYGVYLLQGIAFLVFFAHPLVAKFSDDSPSVFWLITLSAGALLLVLATIAHVAVERPFIDVGRAIAARCSKTPHSKRASRSSGPARLQWTPTPELRTSEARLAGISATTEVSLDSARDLPPS